MVKAELISTLHLYIYFIESKRNYCHHLVNLEKFPIKVEPMSEIEGIRSTRNATCSSKKYKGKITQMCKGFIGSTSRL